MIWKEKWKQQDVAAFPTNVTDALEACNADLFPNVRKLLTILATLHVKYNRHSSYVECNDISTRSIRSFDNLLFKFNVSLPLVTGKLLQKTVAANNVTYKLYNIKILTLPVLLNTKNYLSTGQANT